MGVLGWSPETFWRATPFDICAAIDGWREAHGDATRGRAALVKELRDDLNRFKAENGE